MLNWSTPIDSSSRSFAFACSTVPSTQKRSQISSVTNSPCAAPPRHSERLRPVARDPDRDLGQLLPHPLELELLVVPPHLAAVHEVAHHCERRLELRDFHRLTPDVPHGGVAAANAHHHPAVGEI